MSDINDFDSLDYIEGRNFKDLKRRLKEIDKPIEIEQWIVTHLGRPSVVIRYSKLKKPRAKKLDTKDE